MLPLTLGLYFGRRNYAELYGWVFGAIMLTSGVAPAIMSYVYDVTGQYNISVYAIVTVLAVCGLLCGRLPRFAAIGERQ